MSAADLASGKGHRDENFPVASHLISVRHRPAVMAYYYFARAADDIADNETAGEAEKLAGLEAMRTTLLGEGGGEPTAEGLRTVLRARDLDPVHGLDLLHAFRQDVTKRRYADWAELMDYCRWSAAPVGRYVLDVHGEARTTWAPNDALCAALQIINHLQDCGKDYRALDRVYLPLTILRRHGARVEDLGADQASPALLAAIRECAGRCDELLAQSRRFAREIKDRRLALEVAVIQRLAEDLTARLHRRDPLSERVHHRKGEAIRLALGAVIGRMFGR
jgi:squalene synthase HpnC